ncbi:MAG TPA: bifunctional proline dehydrogenase/L-glutamate gamma-semialdehyde dehydrogenase PutA [Alphaproteobacteria bacterium]|nr:bifunctional proline dehydrogenase/L-glutamate gamma-semialdehyde dehydrogenase PutA [Alphaproteobacteria bacterium]
MTFLANPLPRYDGLRAELDHAYRMDETRVVEALARHATTSDETRRRIEGRAGDLVRGVRKTRHAFGGLEAFLQEYGLSTKEGVALMCLAEALLRIPDAETADLLIEDKIGTADWDTHVGKGESLFVNASTWALMLTGRVVKPDAEDMKQPRTILNRLIRRLGEPVIRQAMIQAMRILGRQFVMGRTIEEALDRAEGPEAKGYRYSYDMLGEAARTHKDAERYFNAYQKAIDAIGKRSAGRGPVKGPGISVKLSALHPRYEAARREEAIALLSERLKALALRARKHDIGFTVDAEEADRLDLSLDIIERVFGDPDLNGWEGFGLAVQAYQKRTYTLIDWLADLSRRHGRRLMVRLVKGAYWDTEVKVAQERGLSGYPVFTRKASTDVSYLACARKLLDRRDLFYPQFATHNAHTLAYVLELAGGHQGFEFQRLHGMGEPLYDQIVGPDLPCRVYAPVGGHEDLLAYLVRRLLENGANTSFVNRLQDEEVPVEAIVEDPVTKVAALPSKPHPRIPLPVDLFQPDRANSRGIDFSDPTTLRPELDAMERASEGQWSAGPMVGDRKTNRPAEPVFDPSDRSRRIGGVVEATVEDAERALDLAHKAARAWNSRGGSYRAAILDRMADLMEQHRAELMAMAVREAGKTLPDALAEVREAIDFCRYYAARAREDFNGAKLLVGPTGEENTLSLQGRGVFVCISPWNFPLAIFTGQVAAALVAGNAVIAKPAEQTPLIAAKAVRLFHEAGVPADVLHLLPGDGTVIGGRLVADPRVAGIAFTGSTDTARIINRALADRPGPIVPFIAETGGQNAMIVDSTALPEQVVADVVTSAFQSAGQRCSALRVLYVQDGIADRLITMLQGYAETLRIGDPALLATDVGPVIDEEARAMLEAHAARIGREGKERIALALGEECSRGCFFAPRAYEIGGIEQLDKEIFGPILHIVRYSAGRLDKVLDAIEATGYGLTLGVHTRIERTAQQVYRRLGVGNTYVNRNMIGAVVGVQPFGGQGLSGTGPKAGGPHYLHRFATERVLTVNTTAAGGNASLVSMAEDDPRIAAQ